MRGGWSEVFDLRSWREKIVDGAREVLEGEVRSGRQLSESEEWHGHMSQNTLNTLKSDKREDNEHSRNVHTFVAS
jgi:hypothetical protein